MPPDELEKTIKSLCRNNLNGEYIKTREELMSRLKSEIPEHSTVAAGSSATLEQLGIRSWLENGPYQYIHCGDGAENRHQNIISSFQADYYISSVAAITGQGDLFLTDGTGNRTAALCYGPKHVIIIASTKKIVPDLPSAIRRLHHTAAPLCAARRSKFNLPCYTTSTCQNCRHPNRMCCYHLTISHSRTPNRFHVYLLDEDVGY